MSEEKKEVVTSSNSKPAKDKSKDSKEKKPKKSFRFFKDLKAEVKKIVWPTRKTVINNTGIVLVFMLISGAFIFLMDVGYRFIFDLIY